MSALSVDNIHRRLCAYSGYALIVLFLAGFGIAGFIIPPSPVSSAAAIAHRYSVHRTAIHVGLVLTMFGAALLVPWSVALGAELRRCLKAKSSALPNVVMLSGTLFSLEFLYLLFFWQVADYRPLHASPQIVRLLNDMGWVPFVGLSSTGIVMVLATGLTILAAKGDSPLFPRWSGYFSLWVAFMFCPASLDVFFRTGPFAYNGLLAWYVPLICFAVWAIVMTFLATRAIGRPGEEPVEEPGDVKWHEIEREIADLRRAVARYESVTTH